MPIIAHIHFVTFFFACNSTCTPENTKQQEKQRHSGKPLSIESKMLVELNKEKPRLLILREMVWYEDEIANYICMNLQLL